MKSDRTYTHIMTKVTYLNTLSLEALRNQNYSYAIDLITEIVDIYD